MEKLIFKYLNSTYPKTYRKLTKFGYDIRGYNETNRDWFHVRQDMYRTIMTLFSCNWITADEMINKWIDTLWVLDDSKLSTTERIAMSKLYNIDC
jgi:hypothetical protein